MPNQRQSGWGGITVKLHVLAVAFLWGTSTLAFAADPGAPVDEPPAVYDWSGVYLGALAGYGWSDNHYGHTSDDFTQVVDFSGNGFLGGLTLGANFQRGSWVYGVEADISYADVDGSALILPEGMPCAIEGCTSNIDWFGTGRVRLGYAFDRFLPFVTGGAAFARLKGTADTGSCNWADCSYSDTEFGWTLGAGMEFGITEQISLKADYLHVGFGKPDFIDHHPWGRAFVDDISLDTVRIGLNYRF